MKIFKTPAFHFTLLFLLLTAVVGQAQTAVSYRQPANAKAIPQLVKDTFRQQYPDVMLKGWFVTHISYWQNDISSSWYSDWYGQRTVVVYSFEKPTYFEVEFMNSPGELSRAIYNLYGYWYETRSQVRSLPSAVIDALKASEYSGWKVSPLKERIESPGWLLDVYRFKVSKGLKSRIIRIDSKGNIVQAKYLNE